ncbi:MmcB family DNA repair protein [Sphingosinicella sp. LHD-64]|uniref:MmcB family DNA repair protein n=1 Tax=Sphingosinicella sp. LHD-64 TaxID=3072139 RepID=UPI00280FDD51|nr:MmcB family DNA repair protein [Sphingosinicella sp. LHD-64]MDQ8757015.1 MmcB family DNA repair protein [Sphingosinicella sp. LHD-64]
MASLPDSPRTDCFAGLPLVAQDVARGVTRLFFRSDLYGICEVPLPNGRRADMMAICSRGLLTIVEIKVSRADLIGDHKWTDYLDYCDRFFWAVPAGFALEPFDGEALGHDCAGLIIADRYDAEVIREAPYRPLAAARRKAETLRFARRAARRLAGDLDPGLAGLD